MRSRRPPGWALASALAAPALLVGGWTVAAARQPAGYDSTVETISSLAGLGAADRWLMTTALLGVGAAHCVTAYGLRACAPAGRITLALGGLSTVLVALFPLPRSGSSAAHTASAALAFGALAVWPLLTAPRGPTIPAASRGARTPAVLRPPVAAGAGALLLGLVGWFLVALATGASVGLAERAAAGAQALWPLTVVAVLRRVT